MRALRLVLVTILIAGVAQTISLSSASATPCPSGGEQSDGPHEFWQPPDGTVQGIRAPLELKAGGDLCVGGSPLAFTATWIGIERDPSNQSVQQIGLLHQVNPISGYGEFCKWYAHDFPPYIHAYRCGQLTPETYYFFRVVEKGAGPTAHYFLDDCGTDSSYSNCTSKYLTDTVWDESMGLDMAESGYGTGCQSKIMGNSGDPANIGTDVNPIEGLLPGGAWTARDLIRWSQRAGQCGHYKFNSTTVHSTQNHTKMGYYDDRN